MEHRRRRRNRAFALVKIQDYHEQCVTGLVYNVNHDGVFILSTATLKVDSIVNICMWITGKNSLLIPVSGIVIHRNKNGFGLMFCTKESSTRQLADKMLSSYSEFTYSFPKNFSTFLPVTGSPKP